MEALHCGAQIDGCVAADNCSCGCGKCVAADKCQCNGDTILICRYCATKKKD